MNEALSPESVISDLPDWRGATPTKLANGLTNETWLLQKGDRKAVLKIDERPRQAPYNSRLDEAAVQSLAAEAGLANKVLFADSQIYLTAYVEGSPWNPEDLDRAGKIEQLASTLRRLHTLPTTGRTFDALAAAQQYSKSIEYSDKQPVSVCMDVIKNTPLPNYLCFSHNDLVAENILTTPELKFIDWEFACDNNPMFDLATVVEHHELNEGQTQSLLEKYFGGSSERWHPQLVEQQRLYLALYWMWLASRPDSSNRALRRLAERLTTSCS